MVAQSESWIIRNHRECRQLLLLKSSKDIFLTYSWVWLNKYLNIQVMLNTWQLCQRWREKLAWKAPVQGLIVVEHGWVCSEFSCPDQGRTQSFGDSAGEGALWLKCNIVLNVCDFPNLSVRRSHDHVVTELTFPIKLFCSVATEKFMKKDETGKCWWLFLKEIKSAYKELVLLFRSYMFVMESRINFCPVF